jgi:peptidase M28-like protein
VAFRFLALFLVLLPAAALAGPVAEEALRRHIEILASDGFEGRAPGTAGEEKTVAYISRELAAIGLAPAGEDGSWYQPVAFATRRPTGQAADFRGRRGRVRLGGEEIFLVGRGAAERIARAPVVFAGHGAVMPEHGIDHLAGADLEGAIVLILFQGPDLPGFPSYRARARAVAERGAAAVLGIFPEYFPWGVIESFHADGPPRLEGAAMAPLEGAITQAAAERLARAAGTRLDALLNAQSGPAFRAQRLELIATIEAETQVRRIVSRNVVGRLAGSGATGEAVLFLGHWDHLGLCRPEGEADRICNGAVDNASGIAALLEIARALAAGPRPKRDILFLATTAEELGLFGAERFAAAPPVPLDRIVAALNLDTVAIAPRGRPVAVIGRGYAPLDRLIAETAAEQGRAIDEDEEADSFIDRQDGWALTRAGIPAAMVGGAFSDMDELGRFLSGPYHGTNDEAEPGLELGGAAEDADLLVALARKLADPALYQRPQPPPAQVP